MRKYALKFVVKAKEFEFNLFNIHVQKHFKYSIEITSSNYRCCKNLDHIIVGLHRPQSSSL